MNAMRFVDANILLYSISTDITESEKAAVAAALLDQADLGLSVQVLQEFYVQATHPRRPHPLSSEDALALVSTWLRYPVQETTARLVQVAATSSERWQISYWDAAIVEAARALRCTQVLTEHLNDGQDFAGVVAVNPFARKSGSGDAPASPATS
jgi:predicted nucleic acid-binding protein